MSSKERESRVRDLVREAWLAIRRDADNNPQRAINLYSQALEFDPDNVSALVGRCQALKQIGNLDGAKGDVERLFELEPSDHDLVLMSSVYEGRERLDFLAKAVHRMSKDSIFRQEILKELSSDS